MRPLLLLLPLTLLAGCYPYDPYYGPAGAYAQASPYPPGPPYGGPPMSRGGPPPAYARGQAGTGENCGTPDQFKPCPPLPRNPLPYYPANKE
jgi:hypothetical protein